MEVALQAEEFVSHNPFPFCFIVCCRKQPMTVNRINMLEWLVYQVVIVYPVVYFLQTLFAAEGLLSRSPGVQIFSLLLRMLSTLSGIICLYGYAILGKASHFALQQFFMRGKYVSISLVVACNTFQGFIIRVVDRFSPLPCGFPYPDREQAFLYQSYIFFYEVFVISILAWFAYRRKEDGLEVVINQSQKARYRNVSAEGDVIKMPIPNSSNNSTQSSGNNSLHEGEEHIKDLPGEMTV